MTTVANAPVLQTRHRRLDVSVWRNESDGRTFFNAKLRRSYKQDETWQSTSVTFHRENLLPASKLLDWADDAIGQAIEKNVKAESEERPLTSKTRGRLEVAVWQRVGEQGTFYRVSLKRSFKDGDVWRDSRAWLGGDDCLSAARLLVRTFDAIDEFAASANGSFVESAKDTFGANVVDKGDEDIPF